MTLKIPAKERGLYKANIDQKSRNLPACPV